MRGANQELQQQISDQIASSDKLCRAARGKPQTNRSVDSDYSGGDPGEWDPAFARPGRRADLAPEVGFNGR
jgi:hypothetical protein